MFDLLYKFLIYFLNIFVAFIFYFFVRIFIVYNRIHNSKSILRQPKVSHAKLMVILGSGGHTFEMFQLLRNINAKFTPTIYVTANSDKVSKRKAVQFEEKRHTKADARNYLFDTVPRSREVGQSFFSTVFTTLWSCIFSGWVVYKHEPAVILCNGPGTCYPICLSAFLWHVLGGPHIKIIFVESICRVRTLSLCGKLLYYISDHFLVQWSQLREKYPMAKYMGQLI